MTLNEDRNITWEEFEMRMSATLRAAEERKQDPEEPFEDSVFDTISCLLLSAGKGRWSERPRTYLVLRLIRQVRAMEGFVGEGLSDIEFPYEETRIPDCLESHQARQDFLQKQSMVLTLTAASLVTGDRHRHIGMFITHRKPLSWQELTLFRWQCGRHFHRHSNAGERRTRRGASGDKQTEPPDIRGESTHCESHSSYYSSAS